MQYKMYVSMLFMQQKNKKKSVLYWMKLVTDVSKFKFSEWQL